MNHRLSYEERSKLCTNPSAKILFQWMQEKQSNLAVAADVTTAKQLLELADALGPYICVYKTHIDIIKDFTSDVIDRLVKIAEKHKFLIFEDRKFADIGNTVQHQYKAGIYNIASWAHITNAHILPGPGIIQGLKEIGLPLGRGLLLLAEMSSTGSFITESYTHSAVELAKQHGDFVIGFIAQRKLIEDPRYIHMTPGVSVSSRGDMLGQHYNSPEYVIGIQGSDIIIVGRGIIEAKNPVEAAQFYKNAGWNAYCSQKSPLSNT
jgi:orotidine 5'-phosphate decarboxylase subfamily 1